MTIYLSAHYNLSRFRGAITQDHIRRYQQVIDWFTSEPKIKGTISTNSLFLQSIIWENESIIKDISKLCLADKIDISSSLYSNYVPFNLPSEDEMLGFQIREAARILKDIYPEKYIKGYYPPFSVCDDRSVKHLVEEGISYIIVDWSILDRILHKKPIGEIDPSFSKPFKVTNQNMFVLPSYNLRTVYRLFPEMYKEYLNSGVMDGLLETIRVGSSISEEQGIDLFGILTIDLNDLKFPTFSSDFDFDNYFKESRVLVNEHTTFVKPSEILDRFDITEIDLKHLLPHELNLVINQKENFDLSPSCRGILKSFKNAKRIIQEGKKTAEKLPEEKRKNVYKLIRHSEYFFAQAYHNLCYGYFDVPLKGVNLLELANIWKSINHLNLIDMIIQTFQPPDTKKEKQHIFSSYEDCGDLVFFNQHLVSSFYQKGGIINNLVNKKKGEFIVSSPSQNLCLNQQSMEPQFGLLFDVVSKKYSGQYNLFNEGYTISQKEIDGGVEICLSTFATGDILLRKYCTFKQNSSNIGIRYSFENRGDSKEEFSLYSISRFNFGDYIEPVFSKEDLLHNTSTNKNEVTISLGNKKTSSKVEVKLPDSISFNIKKSFRNLELTLRMKVPALSLDEAKEYNFTLVIE